KQLFVDQKFLVPIEIFQGYSAFRPPDWLIRITPAGDLNYLELEENNGVNINTRAGDTRRDSFGTLQEAFFEYHLGDISTHYDILAARAGRQLFISDFRGFIYDDVGDGFRIFGNALSNRI